MKRFLLTFLGSALTGAVAAYFLTLHFKEDAVIHIFGTKVPVVLEERVFSSRDFYLALGSAAGIGALAATLVTWLLFTSPRKRRR
ncbi:MAG TPA: hypothetical protein ENK02_06820 [Planctomycetes bacterium]|nr:hypothetical protein [Planctomycetota bacterium]